MSQRKDAELVATAAAIMVQENLEHVGKALKLAARRIRYEPQVWPHAEWVHQAVAAHLQLFGNAQQAKLRTLRSAAIEAMQAIKSGPIRANGVVVSGNVLPESVVSLQVCCDHPDTLLHELMELKIPIDQSRIDRHDSHRIRYQFRAGDVAFEVEAIQHREQFVKGSIDLKALRLLLDS